MTSNNRRTIIYIGSLSLPDKNAAAQRALSLCKSFNNLGYNVVIVGRNIETDPTVPIISTQKKVLGFETFSVNEPTSIAQWVHHTFSAKEYIEIIRHYGADNIKCVVMMEYEAFPLLKLLNFCKTNKIPLVADSLEWFGHSRRSFPFNLVKDFDTWLRMRLIYPYYTKNMICISRYLFNHFRSNVPNIAYIPGTIDPGESKWNTLSYQPNEIFTLGYAGNPGSHFQKERLDLLIRAIFELNLENKACRLLLAGVDENFLQQHKQTYSEYLNSNGLIICKGHLSHLESLKVIASCDFSIIARESTRVTNAGFPTKLSESFGCGTPVLSTKTSNIAEYIPDHTWGIVCNDCTVESIKSMILSAMEFDDAYLRTVHSKILVENPLKYYCFDSDLSNFINNLVV